MNIEEQRRSPLGIECVPTPGGFPWKTASGSLNNPNWWDEMEKEGHEFLYHVDYLAGKIAGSYIKKACTAYASYSDAWVPATCSVDDINAYINHGFDNKGARVIDIDWNPETTCNLSTSCLQRTTAQQGRTASAVSPHLEQVLRIYSRQ